MPDVIVVGAGIAGMTAAIYLRRAEKEVVVFEAQNYGGQIINTLDIENYPAEEHISGFDLASKIYNQAKNLGVKFIFEEVTDITKEDSFKKIITKNNAYKCKAVILATGSRSRKLGLDNESELIGKGVSYCATCDGAFFKNKKVAVVGGGNTALEYALYLSDIAEIVYLVHRSGIFRGSAATVNLLKNKGNVEFIDNSVVSKLNASNELESIEITNNKTGDITNITVDGLFVAIGRVPANKRFAKFVKLDDAGYILSDENCHTNVSGVFAAGDTRNKKVHQLITAAADGAIAATEAIKFITGCH